MPRPPPSRSATSSTVSPDGGRTRSRGGEGAQHGDPRPLPPAVLTAIRNERDRLLLEASRRRRLPARHPDPQLGLVRPPPLVVDASPDAPAPALSRVEGDRDGLRRRLDRPLLRLR